MVRTSLLSGFMLDINCPISHKPPAQVGNVGGNTAREPHRQQTWNQAAFQGVEYLCNAGSWYAGRGIFQVDGYTVYAVQTGGNVR